MLKNKNTTSLFCFSPPVMIATFAIEIVLLLFTLFTRKLSRTTKLISLSLFSLAFFQLCEYFVCGGLGLQPEIWSRLGFVAITTLPPLGLHLMYSIARKKANWLVGASYILMLVWIGVFGFNANTFTSHQCVTNYVIFDMTHYLGYLYSAYYYGLLLLGIYKAMQLGQKTKQKSQQQALHGMIMGYLVFMLPTAIVNSVNPETMAGIPSIMCGFAGIFALILVGYILPLTTKRR